MYSILFKEIEDEKELKKLKEFMLLNPEFYPEKIYKPWIDEKCVPRIESNIYKTIISFSENKVIGNLVWRYLDNNQIEIKNLRVKKSNRGRDIGHFMLTQMEKDNPKCSIITDVTINNLSMINFLIRNGYEITSKENIYIPNQYECILEKHPKTIRPKI